MHMEETRGALVSDLPIGLISDILSRLPVHDIGRCKCVCKTWRALAREPHFTYLHFTRSSQMFKHRRHNILLWETENNEEIFSFDEPCQPGDPFFELYIGTGGLFFISNREIVEEEEEEKENIMWETTNISPKKQCFKGLVSASCNGLLCINTLPFYSDGPDVVYNPLTKDHIVLPQSSSHPLCSAFCDYTCGFGFDSVNKKYKVVKCYRDGKFGWDKRLAGMIITLGDSSWRTLEFPDEVKTCIYTIKPVFYNGAFHWLIGKRRLVGDIINGHKTESHYEGLLALEISSEKFDITMFSHPLVIPTPYLEPILLENSLALCLVKSSNRAEDPSCDIWQILGANTDGSCLYKHKTFRVASPSFSDLKVFRLLGAFGNGLFLFEAKQESDTWSTHLVFHDSEKDESFLIEMVDAPKHSAAAIFIPSLISPA